MSSLTLITQTLQVGRGHSFIQKPAVNSSHAGVAPGEGVACVFFRRFWHRK